MNTQETSKTELSARVPTRGRRLLFLAATFLSLLLILLVGLYLSILPRLSPRGLLMTNGQCPPLLWPSVPSFCTAAPAM